MRWTILGIIALLIAGTLFALFSKGSTPYQRRPLPPPTFRALDSDSFVMIANPNSDTERLTEWSQAHCGARTQCTVMAWLDPALAPVRYPLTDEQRHAIVLQFIRSNGVETQQWDCRRYSGTICL